MAIFLMQIVSILTRVNIIGFRFIHFWFGMLYVGNAIGYSRLGTSENTKNTYYAIFILVDKLYQTGGIRNEENTNFSWSERLLCTISF